MLPDSQLVADGVLRAGPMNKMVAEHMSGQVDHGNRLWLLLNAEVWYRMHIKNMSAEQLTSDRKTA
jgi:hypothetical protein